MGRRLFLPPIQLQAGRLSFGSVYSEFYVNSKGMISFGGDVIDWTPTSFPKQNTTRLQDTGKTLITDLLVRLCTRLLKTRFT